MLFVFFYSLLMSSESPFEFAKLPDFWSTTKTCDERGTIEGVRVRFDQQEGLLSLNWSKENLNDLSFCFSRLTFYFPLPEQSTPEDDQSFALKICHSSLIIWIECRDHRKSRPTCKVFTCLVSSPEAALTFYSTTHRAPAESDSHLSLVSTLTLGFANQAALLRLLALLTHHVVSSAPSSHIGEVMGCQFSDDVNSLRSWRRNFIEIQCSPKMK